MAEPQPQHPSPNTHPAAAPANMPPQPPAPQHPEAMDVARRIFMHAGGGEKNPPHIQAAARDIAAGALAAINFPPPTPGAIPLQGTINQQAAGTANQPPPPSREHLINNPPMTVHQPHQPDDQNRPSSQDFESAEIHMHNLNGELATPHFTAAWAGEVKSGVKRVDQDRLYAIDRFEEKGFASLWVIDGMGGGGADPDGGRKAAEAIRDSLHEQLTNDQPLIDVQYLAGQETASNPIVKQHFETLMNYGLQKIKDNNVEGGAVLTGAHIIKNDQGLFLVGAGVGDVPFYLVRNGQCISLNRLEGERQNDIDQLVHQKMLADSNLNITDAINEAEIEIDNNQNGNVVTNAVSSRRNNVVISEQSLFNSGVPIALMPGDIIIGGTDGIFGDYSYERLNSGELNIKTLELIVRENPDANSKQLANIILQMARSNEGDPRKRVKNDDRLVAVIRI